MGTISEHWQGRPEEACDALVAAIPDGDSWSHRLASDLVALRAVANHYGVQ